MEMTTGKVDVGPLKETEFYFAFGYFYTQLDDATAVHSRAYVYICSVEDVKRGRDSHKI
jgi:hypothetical protein